MTPQEIISLTETAAHELATDSYEEYKMTGSLYDDSTLKKIQELELKKVRDIPGALADMIYNDKGFLTDMIGDRVYDAGRNKEERLKIINKLKTMRSFESWTLAMNELENTMI